MNISVSKAVVSVLVAQALSIQTSMALDDVDRLIEALKGRNAKLVDANEFSLSFSVESEVLETESIHRGAINHMVRVNKRGKDWSIIRNFHPQASLKNPGSISQEPDYYILRNGKMLFWDSASSSAVVMKIQGKKNFTPGNIMSYLRFAGFDPNRQFLEDGGTRWSDVKEEVWKFFYQPTIPSFFEEFQSTLSLVKRQDGRLLVESVNKHSNVEEQTEIDPSLNYAITRRAIQYQGEPKWEMYFHEFDEITEGLWFPRRFDVRKYASRSNDSSDLWGKVCGIDHFRLTHFAWSADPTAFDVTIPKDIFVSDGTRGMTYQATDEVDPFGGDLKAARVIKRSSGKRLLWRWVIVIVSAIAVGFVVAYYLRTSR